MPEHPPTAYEVDSRWKALILRPSTATPRKIWQCLPLEHREAAVRSSLKAEDARVLGWAQHWVARQQHLRPKTVKQWGPEELSAAAARLTPREPEILLDLLRHLHVIGRPRLLGTYLDAIGIDHEDGVVDELPEVPPPAEAVKEATAALLDEFPPAEVLCYLLTLVVMNRVLVYGVDDWLPTLFAAQAEAEEAVRNDEGEAEQHQSPEPDRTDEFTMLDQQLVRSVVDCAQGVEGAPGKDQVLDMVHEVMDLSGTRHRSYFHLGFADALFNSPPREHLPAQNESRRKWYWCGFVNGLARGNRWAEICRFFDEEATVRRLGQEGGGPYSTAAPLIFTALTKCARPSEAAEFLTVAALVENPSLAMQVHNHGRDLIWQDRATEARSLMDLLGRLLDFLDENGYDTSSDFLLGVRRRRAHCYRQLGELVKARGILEHLLQMEYDSEIRAMALTDMGLIDGGFRNLAEVRLPADEERVSDVRTALEAGEPLFKAGAEADARYSAHGRYCLGVLAMTRRDWSAASRDLERALSVFEAEPSRYGIGDLVSHARLYLGVSIALELHAVRARRAAELIGQGLEAGLKVPGYLLEPTMEGLQLASPEDARPLAARLLEADAGALDTLARTDLLQESAVVQEALLQRSANPHRSMASRAQDLRTVLKPLLRRGRLEDASMALDQLEEMARAGIGLEEFMELLRNAEELDPAWDPEAARWSRLHLLKQQGAYEPAREILRSQFFQVLHSGRYDARAEAEDILELFTELKPANEDRDDLAQALAASAAPAIPSPPADGSQERTVRVLFVGGDERQAVTTRDIKARIENEYPKIRVDFLHPGWGGNWGGTLDRVREILPRYHAIVIMRFIRTELGKQIRSMVEVPWTPCVGAGRATIERSILRAADWARNQAEVSERR